MSEIDSTEKKARKRQWRLLRTWSDARRLVLLLWPYARTHKVLLLVGGLLSGTVIALRLAQPWPLKLVIDSFSGSTPVFPWLPLDAAAGLVVMSLSYVVISTLAGLAEYWQLILLSGLGNRVLFSFRNRLFRHVLSHSIAFHEQHDVGELVTRIVSDTSRLRRGVNGVLVRSVQVVFMFLSSIGVVLWLDWRLGIVVALCGGLALFVMGRTGRRILRAARRNRRREGQLAAIVAEDAQGIQELQTFRAQDLGDSRFEGRNEKSLKEEQKVRRLSASLMFRMETFLTLSVCVALWFGAIGVNAGTFSLGSLVLVVHYIVGLYGPFRQFAQQAAQSGRAMACAERLIQVMDAAPEVRNSPLARSVSILKGDIAFDQVSYKGARNRRIGRKWLLSDLSFTVNAGERVAVIGSNGAGKSSLLRLVLRLADPQQGFIHVDGLDIKDYALESLRSHFSVVFQHGAFFTLTVAENIALGNPEASFERVKEVAGRCGIDGWIEKLKYGYSTPVRRQGSLFSGGERQKIAIARALLRDGRIWLLDEPTQSLDAASVEHMTKLLLEATRGRTTLWATHDPGIIAHCHRVLVLREGLCRFYGTPEEFDGWADRTRVGEDTTTDMLRTVSSKGLD